MGARWIAYDWFKLVVLLILIALLLAVRGCSGQAGLPTAAMPDSSAQPNADAAATQAAADAAAAQVQATADASAAQANASAGSESAAAGQGAESTTPAAGSEAATQAPAANGRQADSLSASAICDKALPVRLSGADVRASVTNATLTLRSSPEVGNNVLGFLSAGSEVDVTALPVCTPYLTGANNWWQVTTASGRQGYVAEGSAVNPVYYLEEIK